MGAPRVTLEEAKRRIREVHGDTLIIKSETFIGVAHPCTFVDVEFGEWNALPNNIFRGHGHPKRGYRNVANSILMSRGVSLEEVKRRLYEVHGDTVVLVDDTYVGVAKKCQFIDVEFGKWWATPNNVIACETDHPKRRTQKIKKTCLAKYGVDNPTKDPQILLRAVRNTNKRTILRHWKTDDELICVGSYETLFVKWANANSIDFAWQILHKMPDNHIYVIDAFIKEGMFANTWIEIKGYFRGDAKEKWDWFHSEHPDNSQLWMKKELQNIGILPKSKKSAKLSSA